jgi:hypothetical protein
VVNFYRQEKKLLSDVFVQRNRIKLLLDIAAACGFFLPVLFNSVPKQVKTPLFTLGLVSMMIGTGFAKKDTEQAEGLGQTYRTVEAEINREQMRHTFDQSALQMEVEAKMNQLRFILTQPDDLQALLLERQGLSDFALALVKSRQKQAIATVENHTLQSMSGGVLLAPSQMDWNAPTIVFPVEDIAKLYIQKSLNKDHASGLLVIAPRRTGKTKLIGAIIQYAHHLTEGIADFMIFAGKGDQKYAGLEKDENRYIDSGDVKNVAQAAARMMLIKDELSYREDPRFILSDELNNTVNAASDYDRRHKTQKVLDVKETSRTLITKGSSLGTIFIATSHELRVDAIGFNTALYSSISSIILGRNIEGSPNYGSIAEALSGKNDIVDNADLREILNEQFKAYRNHPSINDSKEVLCLTNVGGNWRLCLLPDYTRWDMPDIYQPDITAAVKQETKEASKKGFEALVAWTSAVKNENVSDEQIVEKIKSLLGTVPNPDMIKLIRDEYIGKQL